MSQIAIETFYAVLMGAFFWGAWVTNGLFRMRELVTKIELLETKAQLVQEIRGIHETKSPTTTSSSVITIDN